MVANEKYMADYIENLDPMIKYRKECDSILEKTLTCAQKNTNLLNEISASMEEHNGLMADYTLKRGMLEDILKRIQEFKKQSNPKELANEVAKRGNEIQKESDKIRKQFNKGEISTDMFLQEYLKTRVKYYENDSAKQRLFTMPG